MAESSKDPVRPLNDSARRPAGENPAGTGRGGSSGINSGLQPGGTTPGTRGLGGLGSIGTGGGSTAATGAQGSAVQTSGMSGAETNDSAPGGGMTDHAPQSGIPDLVEGAVKKHPEDRKV